ncbi:hypothetical protein B0H14DRAFT_2364689, partial [Mycena olivaceomarginata]
LLNALIRLSRQSKLHPRCLTPTGTQLPDLGKQNRVACGRFADIYQSVLQGHSVALGREALIWRQLCHPNVLPFSDCTPSKTALCLVSPWMEMGTISQFQARILDVALGLQYLHEQDIVHGDLKGVRCPFPALSP